MKLQRLVSLSSHNKIYWLVYLFQVTPLLNYFWGQFFFHFIFFSFFFLTVRCSTSPMIEKNGNNNNNNKQLQTHVEVTCFNRWFQPVHTCTTCVPLRAQKKLYVFSLSPDMLWIFLSRKKMRKISVQECVDKWHTFMHRFSLFIYYIYFGGTLWIKAILTDNRTTCLHGQRR